MAKQIFINLAVTDLQRSMDFYTGIPNRLCIKFKKLKDINDEVLEAAIGYGFEVK